MKNLKRNKLITLAVLLIITVAISLLAINMFQKLPQSVANDTTQTSPQNTPSNAKLNNAGYLEHRNQQSMIIEESKLFLVSANASYGVYSANAQWPGGKFDGQDCFVITATIRNDYTAEELQSASFYGDHTGRVYFAVSATIYSGTSQVSANDVSGAIIGSMSPPLGVPQWWVRCGETDTIEIYVATNNKNIDNYSINIIMLELSGLPIP
jgi:hypothetical protein